jgi:hypothetical protein
LNNIKLEENKYNPCGDNETYSYVIKNLIYQNIDSFDKYSTINNEIFTTIPEETFVEEVKIKNIKILNSEFDNYFNTFEDRNNICKYKNLESILIENSFKQKNMESSVIESIINNLNFNYQNLNMNLTPLPYSNLSQLIIKNCDLTSDNLFPIFNLLKYQKIYTLNLSNNLLDNKAMHYFDLFYNTIPNKNNNFNKPEILNISKNKICDESFPSLISMLNSFSGNLELNGNNLTNKFLNHFTGKILELKQKGKRKLKPTVTKSSKSIKLFLKNINFDYKCLKNIRCIDSYLSDFFNLTIYISENLLSDEEAEKLKKKKINCLELN